MRVRETPSVTPGGVLVLANDTPLGTNRVAVTPADQPTNRIKSTATHRSTAGRNSRRRCPSTGSATATTIRSIVVEPGACRRGQSRHSANGGSWKTSPSDDCGECENRSLVPPAPEHSVRAPKVGLPLAGPRRPQKTVRAHIVSQVRVFRDYSLWP